MSRKGAPAARRPASEGMQRFSGAELVDGTTFTESVFWHYRWHGLILLDGSHQFFPAAQVKRCWWDVEESDD